MRMIESTAVKRNHCQQLLLFFALTAIIMLKTATVYAEGYSYTEAPYSEACGNRYWRPVLALGAGFISSSSMGTSASFPIVNPVVDSFYTYIPDSGRSASGIVDAFLGIEWGFGSTGAGLQLGIGYAQAVPLNVQGTLVQGTSSTQGTYTYEYNITPKQLLFEAKLFGAIANYYHPYIFGGVGKSFNRSYQYSTSVPPFLTFTRMYDPNTTTENSYAVGAGLDIDLDSTFRVGIGYRYASFGSASLGNAVIDTTPVSGTLSQSSLFANEILVQVTCGF